MIRVERGRIKSFHFAFMETKSILSLSQTNCCVDKPPSISVDNKIYHFNLVLRMLRMWVIKNTSPTGGSGERSVRIEKAPTSSKIQVALIAPREF